MIHTIIYKSGVYVHVECENLTATRSNQTGELLSIKWDGAMKPRPLFIGINDIAAIYVGRVKPA